MANGEVRLLTTLQRVDFYTDDDDVPLGHFTASKTSPDGRHPENRTEGRGSSDGNVSIYLIFSTLFHHILVLLSATVFSSAFIVNIMSNKHHLPNERLLT